MLVVHCTELPDLETAREYGERILYPESGTGNSGHYYIDRDGRIELWVPENRVAHHVRDFNHRSIGVELVNRGRYPDWFHSRNQQLTETYPEAQIEALRQLTTSLVARLAGLRYIAGHEDLDNGTVAASDDSRITVRRKCDPGPLFPWPELVPVCGLERYRAPQQTG
ncbi:MAG: N-acetylmuramoyl-L-alanine amidase [Xanthomonadales bacterium]|nr:N-acetylmuramoyl-L-alanine amidase [Xanthomonadales bacterium]